MVVAFGERLLDRFALRVFLPLPLLAMACSACSENGRSPVEPPDEASPLIEIRFPTTQSYDRDGDGLVDLEVAFSDSLSGVELESIEISTDARIKGPAGRGSNLRSFWRMERLDSLGLVVEETVDNLLPRGQVRLFVRVADRVGNEGSAAVTLDLPPAARHKAIDLQSNLFTTSEVLLAPDGRRLYVTSDEQGSSTIAVVDPWSLSLVRTVRTPLRGLARMALDADRGRLYAMSVDLGELAVFDVEAEAFLPSIPVETRGIGLALSRQRQELYIALEVEGPENGVLAVVDLVTGRQSRLLDLDISNPNNPGLALGIQGLVLDPAQERLYAGTSGLLAQLGILVINLDQGVVTDTIDLEPDISEFFGGVRDLIWDGNHLVGTSGTIATGNGRLVLVDPTTPVVDRFGDLGTTDPYRITVSPNRQDYLVTGSGREFRYYGVMLVSAGTLEVLWEERTPLPSGLPQGVAFRPDGNVFFVAAGDAEPTDIGPNRLRVYLYR